MNATAWVTQVLEVLAALAAAPLFLGWVNKCRAWLQNRSAPSLLLPYYLTLLGYGALEIGAIVTATLLGSGLMTLGVGLIAHRYRQAVRDDDDVRGSPISAELSGDDRDIGTEIDVAFSTRLAKPVALEAKVGWFMPGKGFDTFRKDAILAKVRLVIRF